MITLADLNTNQVGTTLSDINTLQPTPPAVNQATANNVAAHAAVLTSPDDLMRTYASINTDLQNGVQSPALDNLLVDAASTDKQATYDELQRILRDPNLTPQVKAQYYDGYMSMSTDHPGDRSLSIRVAESALAQPQSPEENDETVDTTIDVNGILDSVDAYKGWVQNAVNTQTSLQNRDGFNLFLDFAESMFPFLDQAAVAKSRAAQDGSLNGMFKSLTLLGDSKVEVRNAIKAMPIEQRYKVAQQLIDIVKSTGGSFTLRPNELSVVNQLNAFLVDGAYTDSDKMLDNIFSVIDLVTPVSGWIGKAFKGAKAGKEAAIIAERSAAAEDRLAKAGTLVPEAADMPRTELPSAPNVVENALTLRGKTMSPTEPLTKPGELRPTVNLIDRNLSREAQKGERAPTGFEIGRQGPDKPIMDQLDDLDVSNMERLTTRTTVDQTSLSSTMTLANAGKARQINALMEADQSGQAAKSLYGTTREEAIANDRLPEVANSDGSVRHKVNMDDSGPAPDQKVIDSLAQDVGRTDLDAKEKTIMRDKVKDDFRDVVGLVPRTAMSTIRDTPQGVGIDMVYGPRDGGFRKADQAVNQVLPALRKYGVTEKEIEVLALDATGGYSPVKGVPKAEGNYLVRVKHDYNFATRDITGDEYSALTGTGLRHLENRISATDGKMGSIREHIIPASSVINKVIYNSASAASDRAAKIMKQLVDLGVKYAKKYKALPKDMQKMVDEYRIEANDKGLKFSRSDLKGRGFSEEAIDTLSSWKTTTDTMWFLENADVNKTLDARGWQRYIDRNSDTDLIARPINKPAGPIDVYDSTTHSVRHVSPEELEELYAKNGTIAELKEPLELFDDAITHVIAPNTDTGYLRRIRPDDATLPYRDGYYPIKYNDPIFITKEFHGKNGTYTKAIATAGSHEDANALLARLRQTDKEGVYASRYDLRRGSSDFEDADWSAAVSGGRSAQRVRGQRLGNASTITDLNHKHIDSPEESLVTAIRSLSSRVAFRDWSETTKSRWIAKYGDLLTTKGMWPEDPRLIGAHKLEADSGRVKDAIATWRFVRQMEDGYVNLIDDFTKNFMRNVADTSGRSKSFKWLEKPLSKASGVRPTTTARGMAFKLLLAANPLRQLPVQAMQALPVLLATNPLHIPRLPFQMTLLDFMATGGDARTFMRALGEKLTGMTPKDAQELAKHWESSGFEAAVDANSLIRDQLQSLVNRGVVQKVGHAVGTPLRLAQQFGFNQGEKILMRSVWLSEYDLLRKSGKVIDAEALENLNARVRNLTLNMNKAGEMPYNENMFSAAMQFFQAPHKAWGQVVLGHTGLSTADRIKLGTAYLLTYGIGANYLSQMVLDHIQMDQNTREAMEGGFFNLALNSAASAVFQDKQAVDYSSSFRILDPDIFNLWTGMMTSDVGDMISNSPSMSLVIGNSPRLTNFVKQMMRPFTVDNDKKPEELLYTGKAFLDLFSGLSNIAKAKYAYDLHKTMTSKGATVDYHVTGFEAIMKSLGFNTIDEMQYYASQDEIYSKGDKYKQDIKTVIDEVSSRLASRGEGQESDDWYIDMMAEAQRIFEGKPQYMQEFADQIKYKAMNNEYSLYTRLRNMAGWMDEGEFEKMVSNTNLPDEAKETLIKAKRMFSVDTPTAAPAQDSLSKAPIPAVKGNIDIDNRQVVHNSDGSISTEESMSFEEDGLEVLIPTVFDGKHHTEEQAIEHYRETGQHLGKFKTWQEADAYADILHNRQGEKYKGK